MSQGLWENEEMGSGQPLPALAGWRRKPVCGDALQWLGGGEGALVGSSVGEWGSDQHC